MAIAEYDRLDALGLAALVACGDVKPDELLDEALARAERVNPALNAIVHVREEAARAMIGATLPDGPFRGVPFLLKDLGAEAAAFPSSNGSRLFTPTEYGYDSAVYARLRAAGLVTFARTTSPELGIGPTTEAQVYGGPTRNPWSTDHTSGGSSGGTAAAVAAGVIPAAHGSDGGGSVRIPAASCGLFGLKVTRARIPDGPASGEGWGGMSTDGFLTRSVRDSAALLDAVHGPDLGAPYHAPAFGGSYLDAIASPPPRLRVAFSLKSFTGADVHPDVRTAIEEAASLCEALGHVVFERDPRFDVVSLMRQWARIVACGTALSVRQKVSARGRPLEDHEIEGVTHGAIAFAEGVTGSDYLASLNAVHAFGRRVAAFFTDCDMLLTGTLAEPPARIGRFKPDNRDFADYRLGERGVVHYCPFPPVFNASGQPAMNVPLSWNAEGLPIGVQFAARAGGEVELLQLAAQLEQAQPWADRRPPVWSGATVDPTA